MSLHGSSFVATRAPNKFAGIPRPRPLTHGTAHATVSPRTFSLPKAAASRAGSVDGNFTDTSRSAGPFSFLQASQIFTFIPRQILGAKYKNAPMQIRKITKARTGLKCTRASPPSTAASSPRLNPIFENGSGEELVARRVAAFAVCATRLVPPASKATITVNIGLG